MEKIEINDLVVGTAAEYIVCADLLLSGFNAFRADQAAAYDVAVDVDGRLIRVQVKGTREPRKYLQQRQTHILGYSWYCRHGKGGVRAYSDNAFDVLALVALDIKKIAYISASNRKQTIQIHVSGASKSPCRTFESSTFMEAIK